MDVLTTEELESKIKELIDLAEKFAEPYRQKIFEVLLTDHLKGLHEAKEPPQKAETAPTPLPEKFIIPIDVRAVLSQYGVAEENIQKLFVTQGSEIRPTYSIKTASKSEAQMQVTLLTALENALKPGGLFEFSVEEVRQRCISRRIYDRANFARFFKSNSKLFEDLKDKEHIKLSPDGKSELAEAIMAVAA